MRSNTLRNLIGGFLGGAAGILVSYYIAPWALPLGVFAGVIIGWWAKDIARLAVYSVRSAFALCQKFSFASLASGIMAELAELYDQSIAEIGRAFAFFGRCLYRAACAVFSERFVKFMAHPMTRARLITAGAFAAVFAAQAAAIVAFYPWPETWERYTSYARTTAEVLPFGTTEVAFGTFMALISPFMFALIGRVLVETRRGDGNETRTFYASWEEYSRTPMLVYAAREIVHVIRAEIVMSVFVALTFAYWVTLGGALLTFVVVPVVAFVLFMAGLYRIASRGGHWWCFGVTLVVTMTSALIFYGTFVNPLALWMTALGTGVASGAATEGVLRLGIWWSRTPAGQHYLAILRDEEKFLIASIAVPAWKMLGRAFGRVSAPFVFALS